MKNSRVLVIGGTRGTGLLIACLLLQEGYQVRVMARNPDKVIPRLDSKVEVISGDITKPETLFPAVQGVNHIIFTAGVRSGRFARENLVKETDYQGVLNTLNAARQGGFSGRFLYLNSIGIHTPSFSAFLLNMLKKNTLVWRRHVEKKIRSSGLDYTIIRVGFLLNRSGGRYAVEVSQGALPLTPKNRISRADVAMVFVEALKHPRASKTTFEIVWRKGNNREEWSALLDGLQPDS